MISPLSNTLAPDVAASDAPVAAPTPDALPPRLHLAYLDGLRGFAAAFVMLSHGYKWMLMYGDYSGATRLVVKLLHPLAYGRYSVNLFVVLSGFCLMLPVARRAAKGEKSGLPGGFVAFMKRRVIRILPTYYAAVLLALIVDVACLNGKHALGLPTTPNRSSPEALAVLPFDTFVQGSLDPLNLLAHVFLMHNMRLQWAPTINPSLWNIATEWQIYLIFPTIILPIWVRFGNRVTVAFGLLLGWALLWLSGGELENASLWFVGLFAMGMAAAHLTFTQEARLLKMRENTPWLTIAVSITLGIALFGIVKKGGVSDYEWIVDAVFGVAAASLILFCARALQHKTRPWPLRIFEHPALVRVGVFSYSLYLTHYLVVFMWDFGMAYLKPAPTLRVLTTLLIYPPLALLFAYGFHLAVERRFINAPEAAKPRETPREESARVERNAAKNPAI